MRAFLLCAFCALVLGAQAPNLKKRPRMGLALEGGAALGFAHIGVLEWLEANRIPVDMVAGTSMGGLIGGLYSAGYTPKEIRAIAGDADWQMLVGEDISFRELSYRRKEDRIAFPNRLELGLKGGLSLPAGFNDGHKIGLMLSRLTLGYPSLKSFDELPTAFRCVSVDLVSGADKVWDSGLLNDALRSTMSAPGFFSPVRKDKSIYVDGSLLNNLPVDVAKEMGADLVIAVHLNKGPVDPKKIGNAVEVLQRSITVVIGAAEMRTIQLADVVLVADLASFRSGDYARSKEIIEAGAAAAEAKASILRRFALDEDEYKAYQHARSLRIRKVPETAPQFIAVQGADAKTNAAVQEKLVELADRKVDIPQFESELTKMAGLGRFASIGYQQAIRNGESGLEVRINPKPSGPITLNPTFEINGVDTSNSRLSMGARITWRDISGFRSEWRNDFFFGSRFAAASEIYKPIKPNSRFFVAPRVYVDSNPFDLYSQGAAVSTYRLRQQGAAFDTGFLFSRLAELRFGYQFNWFAANRRIGLPLLSNDRFRRDAVSLRFNYEGQDDAVMARRGLRFNSRAEYYPAYGYTLGELRMVDAIPITAQDSLVLAFSSGGTVGSAVNSFLAFSLGGPQRLSAYGINEILARNYAIGIFGILHEVKSQPSLLGSKLFFTAFAQTARTRDIFDGLRYPASGTGAAVLQTLFGPVFIGASVGDRGHRKWFFGMGRLF